MSQSVTKARQILNTLGPTEQTRRAAAERIFRQLREAQAADTSSRPAEMPRVSPSLR